MQIGQYAIPKGTTVFAFLYNIHHDPKYYKDPKKFNPDRFIDGSGKFVLDERIIPFGIGKRACQFYLVSIL
jgi:cytochrome P450